MGWLMGGGHGGVMCRENRKSRQWSMRACVMGVGVSGAEEGVHVDCREPSECRCHRPAAPRGQYQHLAAWPAYYGAMQVGASTRDLAMSCSSSSHTRNTAS